MTKSMTKNMTKNKTESIEGHDEDKFGADEWALILHALRQSLGELKFNRWLAPLEFGYIEHDRVVLYAATRFLANWISDHYGNKLRQHWQEKIPEILRVDIIHQAGMAGRAVASMPLRTSIPNAPAPVETPLNPRLEFENFIIGDVNRLAHHSARALAESCAGSIAAGGIAEAGDLHQGPLFIHGDIGQGKTHLLHAIANYLRRQNGQSARPCRVMNLSAERFRYHFIRSLRRDDMMAFKHIFGDIDVLIMDDLQFLSGRATQDEFFHILNTVHDNRGQLVFAATKPPSSLDKLDARIRSRLGGGLVVDVQPADNALRLDILRVKLRRLSPPINISPLLPAFLAQNITSNIRELEGALNRIVAHARYASKPVDTDQARLILRDLLQAGEKRITISDIQRKTAKYYDISLNDLLSARRQRSIARPRQIAMFLAKQLTPRSLPDIGRRFGGRDHTTVLHALRRVEALIASDRRIESDVANLRQQCQAASARANDDRANNDGANNDGANNDKDEYDRPHF